MIEDEHDWLRGDQWTPEQIAAVMAKGPVPVRFLTLEEFRQRFPSPEPQPEKS